MTTVTLFVDKSNDAITTASGKWRAFVVSFASFVIHSRLGIFSELTLFSKVFN